MTLGEEKAEIIERVCENLPVPLKKNKKNEWIRIGISSPCLFVLRGVRTHHVVYTRYKWWN